MIAAMLENDMPMPRGELMKTVKPVIGLEGKMVVVVVPGTVVVVVEVAAVF